MLASTDAPSVAQPVVRPFGLSRATPLSATGGQVLPDYPYDPVRQISLTNSGQPVMADTRSGDEEESGENPGTTHTNTQYDHQWETDTD